MGEDYNASDIKHVSERAKKSKQAAVLRDDAFKAIMSVRNGRLWIWEMLCQCGVYQSSFHHDNAVMAFNEGKRDVGLHVMEQIMRLCPDLFVTMSKEANGLL